MVTQFTEAYMPSQDLNMITYLDMFLKTKLYILQ